MAKVVLDEIGNRLRLVEELSIRVNDKNTKEVQQLQPLFQKGLWIFGPEFETIEYTSNQSMTSVVQELFKHPEITGSKNRPDFVILPDGTSGLYSYPCFDEDGGETGIDRLVIVELKKPGVKIGQEQKSQCWKYITELYKKGQITSTTASVRCFVLGSEVDDFESSPRTELNGIVSIQPILFGTVLTRAKSRLLKLHERVKNAPFMEAHKESIEKFLAPIVTEADLFEKVTA